MSKWIATAGGGLTAIALGLVVWGPNQGVTPSVGSADKLALPMEKEDVPTSTQTAATPPKNIAQGQSRPTTSASAPARTASHVRIYDAPQQPQRWAFRVVDADRSVPDYVAPRPNRRSLTRSIQSEINRVGCGNVSVNGTWDRRTRSAMARFAANRNAALPTDKPDVILLSLLQTYSGTSCGHGQSHQIASGTSPLRLTQPPRLVHRPQRPSIVSGWSARTTRSLRTTSAAADTLNTPTTRRSAARYPSTVQNRYQPSSRKTLTDSRMALGVRPSSGARNTPPPVTVQPGGYVGATEVEANEAERQRLDALRAAELRRAELKRRRAAKRRQRQARRRYLRRRQPSWRERALASD